MDRVDEVADLRDDVDRVAQRFERAAASPGPFVGKDGSGCVSVTADAAGLILEVRVVPDWRSDLEPHELAAAVMAAFQAAGLRRVEEWGTALAGAAEGPAPSVRPLPPFRESISGRLEELVRVGAGEEETRAIMDAIAEFLREVNASVDEATEAVARAQGAEVRGASDHGHVEVVVTGTGDLKDLRYDETWLERAHPVNIGRETVQAHQAALRATGGRTVAEVMAGTRLGQLQALAADPEALAHHLRMGR